MLLLFITIILLDSFSSFSFERFVSLFSGLIFLHFHSVFFESILNHSDFIHVLLLLGEVVVPFWPNEKRYILHSQMLFFSLVMKIVLCFPLFPIAFSAFIVVAVVVSGGTISFTSS